MSHNIEKPIRLADLEPSATLRGVLHGLGFALIMFLSMASVPADALTIVAPTSNVNGSPLALSDLDFYTVECDGVQDSPVPVIADAQDYDENGARQCRATVTTITGEESDWSATWVNPTGVPEAPTLQ